MKTNHPSTALRCALTLTAVALCSTLSAQQSSSSTTSGTSAPTPTAGDRQSDTNATTRANVDMPRTAVATTNANLSRADRNFFEKAAHSGMKEVAVSQATVDRLMNPQVKDFARMMVSDHSGANAELMALAQKKGVVLPAKNDNMKLTEKWSKKTKDVDEDYIEEMVSDHEDAVELFQKAAKSEDAEIAAFAMKTLPTLQQHLKMAQDLEKMVD